MAYNTVCRGVLFTVLYTVLRTVLHTVLYTVLHTVLHTILYTTVIYILLYFILYFVYYCYCTCSPCCDQAKELPERSTGALVAAIFELGLKHSSPKVTHLYDSAVDDVLSSRANYSAAVGGFLEDTVLLILIV